MTDLQTDFQDRCAEVEAYMKLVAAIELAVQQGAPIVRTRSGQNSVVEPLQQKILYGGVYLHLYNLVEATVSRCILAVEVAASNAMRWRANDLSMTMRAEWVRSMAKTHQMLTPEKRLQASIALCDHLVDMLPVTIKIARGGGGNWDDKAITRIAARMGVQIQLSPKTEIDVKRHVRDNRGALELIKDLRNKLAHGEMSFAECGEGCSTSELDELVRRTRTYLEEVIACFEAFITRYEFLEPARRPAPGGP
jgi:hypothetical protein